MIITSIKNLKGKTFLLCVDNEHCFKLNYETIMKFDLQVKMELCEKSLAIINRYENLRKAREYAFHLLEYKDYSSKQMFDKLSKHYEPVVCDKVLTKLRNLNLIDDLKFAQKFAQNSANFKKYGKKRIYIDLLKRGIDKDTIAVALDSICDENTTDVILELLRSKYKNKLVDKNGVQKVKNALLRKGYSYSEINTAFSAID